MTLSPKKRHLVLVLAALALGYALVAFGAFALQRRLLYPVRGTGDVPDLAGATLEKFPGASGRTVHALYAKASDGAPTLVHFHGNGEELADLVDFVSLFQARGFGVLAVEYPGYGLSRHYAPDESVLCDDAEAALRDLVEKKGVPRERLVLSGQSLGTGVAVEMARRGYGARVVLYSPYTSIPDVADKYLPFLPNRWLVRDAFDSAAKAPQIRTPVLVVHGTKDEVIPFELGRKLSSLFPNARLLPLEHAHHNDLFLRGGKPLLDAIARFASGH